MIKFKPTLLFIFLLISIVQEAFSAESLTTYPAPKGAILNDIFDVKVRQNGGKWQDIPTYLIKVDEVRGSKHTVENASMSFFDFEGEVEVQVRYSSGPINTAKIRPLSYGIQTQLKDESITFKLDQPQNLSVEINGDIFHNLHLFANPLVKNVPDKNDPNVIWFGPGIHDFENEKYLVPSGKTVYVDGSAILRGQLLVHDAHDVKIIGRGMVEHTVKMGIHIANSKNILVDGIFCTQCATGGSNHVTIRNVKSISYYGWGDGMNVFASNNVLYDRVFCRNSDDCTTVYATRKGFTGGCSNITMQNSTLWADVAHPIMIGIHGNSEDPDTIRNLTYKNIDILDHKEMQIDYQGCMTINAGDNNLIKDVLFEDIRVEDFREGQLVNLRIFYNEKYCTAPGLGIENITFRNIDYNGNNANLSIIAGYNKERKIKNILFEHLSINGVIISDDMDGKPAWYKTADMARFFVGEHVDGIEFRK